VEVRPRKEVYNNFMKKQITETVLSPESLSIQKPIMPRELFVKSGRFRIFKNIRLRKDRMKRYRLVEPPAVGWFPSRYASFTIDIGRGIDANWYLHLFPDYMNPSVWQNRRNRCYTIRVARNYKREAHKLLYRKGFWFSTKRYIWYRRIRRSRRSGNSGVVQPKELV
jgi:hypothetical protein